MKDVSRFTILLGICCCIVPSLAYTEQRPQTHSSVTAGMQEAIRFQRAEDVAAKKAGRVRASRRADKAQSDSEDATGVREAIRFETAKDAAAARQARLETEHPSGYADPTSTAAANLRVASQK